MARKSISDWGGTIALLTGLNRNTVNRYLLLIRTRIAEYCEQSSLFPGEMEVDESYFGARRIKGKRGRGAYSKTPVFGILQRGSRVYTEMVPDCAKQTLQGIIRGKVDLESVIHSDYLHLKECEFRFNYRTRNIYKLVLKMLREDPLV